MKSELKKTFRVLGVFDLIACVLMFAAFFFMYGIASDYETVWPFFAYALPFMVIAILLLISGVFTLKDKNQIWGFAGVMLFLVGVLYFVIMAAA
jgi:drug/metabolite transporter (DMT)-like permease